MSADFFNHVEHRKQHPERTTILERLKAALAFISGTSLRITQKGISEVSGLEKSDVRYWWPELTVKSQRLNLRCSVIERTLVETKAFKAEMSLSEFLLHAAKKSYIVVLPKTELKQLNIELNRTGRNLNQIARYVNTYKNGAEAVSILAALLRIERELKEFNAVRLRAGEEPYADQII